MKPNPRIVYRYSSPCVFLKLTEDKVGFILHHRIHVGLNVYDFGRRSWTLILALGFVSVWVDLY